ncbi:putative caspase-like protein [Kribbella amoyensis]|uniref:Putative caspase-like protein n=1 Tax=Kribbella amoyensis TaxID=996641 RepID=A0A561BKZ6_9ACTN|nr:caspase family protein [Kribbella amoyensis]TWD79551.1 putative caspase-like protein [Kribbella amoyensis]
MAGRRTALIVANDVYEHEGLGQLRAPAADARALAEVLGDPAIGGFDVHVVRNEAAHVIEGRIEDLFSDSRPDDVLLLHFSCHGLKSESGELFFAATNTRPNRLGSTAVPAEFVQRCLRMSRSRSVVLLLDCCYGGAFSKGVTVRAAGDAHVLDSFGGGRLGGGRGRAVITASSATEYAFEGDRLADDHTSPSVFTAALVDGLASGDADLDQDGWVSLNELYEYVFDRVREQNPQQTPSRDVEMQGELYLARRSHPVTDPAPLPAELLQMIDSPLATLRVGAVAELTGLLQGRNAGLRLAAKATLQRLTEDDSRSVAAAATAALTTVTPEPPAVPSAAPEAPAVAIAEAEAPSGRSAAPSGTASSGTASAEAAPSRTASSDQAPSGTASADLPESAAREQDSAEASADSEQAEPPGEPPGSEAWRRGWWGWSPRRRIASIVGAMVVVAAGVIAVVLLTNGDGRSSTGNSVAGEFSESGPWRVQLRGTNAVDGGCTFTVTDVETGAKTKEYQQVFEERTFQIAQSGTFRVDTSASVCAATHTSGSGQKALPFAQHPGTGDTEAFTLPNDKGALVEVTDFHSYGRCEFVLRDAADGRDLAFGTAQPANRVVRLAAQGSKQVYLGEFYGCDVTVKAG